MASATKISVETVQMACFRRTDEEGNEYNVLDNEIVDVNDPLTILLKMEEQGDYSWHAQRNQR